MRNKTVEWTKENSLNSFRMFLSQSKEKKTLQRQIYVVKNLQTPLLGRPAIEAFQLVTQIKSVTRNGASVISQFPELFEGLGKISGDYCIQMEENAKPYSIYMPRRVPIPLLPKVKQGWRSWE